MEFITELGVKEKEEIEFQLGIKLRFSKLQLDALSIELLKHLALEQNEPW